MTSRERDRDRERGSATVLGLGVILVLVTLLAALLVLGVALRASLQARAGADSAALGGTAESACAAAGELARANNATLTGCSAGGESETVSAVLRVEVTVPALGGAEARAVARAGAVPAPST